YNVPAGIKVIAFDATKIAIEEIGLPITNTTLMGAFAAASGEITLEALKGAIEERFPGKLAATNFAAAKRAYEMIKEGAY
ncbi:MAG TPA: 2-oxoacid:acceptor oxidoreductase family protein, partial [Methanocorpusculum sp.]|nr:2-oxoacid:acceptor oxidoreductase family protein [Methanocorpusculum sp.]